MQIDFSEQSKDRLKELPCSAIQLTVHSKIEVRYNQNDDICGACRGKCCKNHPGIYHPGDLGSTEEEVRTSITEGLESGAMTIDWWEGSPVKNVEFDTNGYFVRASSIVDDGPFNGLWYGKCSRLRDDGCELAWSDRPYQCRTLIPDTSHNCTSIDKRSTKRSLSIEWMPYWKWLSDLHGLHLESNGRAEFIAMLRTM